MTRPDLSGRKDARKDEKKIDGKKKRPYDTWGEIHDETTREGEETRGNIKLICCTLCATRTFFSSL